MNSSSSSSSSSFSTYSSVSSSLPSSTPGALIIGGGIAGLTLALFLRRLHVPVRIFEAYPDLPSTAGACLQLAPNGVAVLKQLDLHGPLLALGSACKSYRFCNESGETVAEMPLHGAEFYGVDAITCARHKLHSLLSRTLQEAGIKVEHSKRLKSLDQTEDAVTATFEDGSIATGSILIGCDGIHSRTRQLIFPNSPLPTFVGYLGAGGIVPFSSLSSAQLELSRATEGVMTVTRGPVGTFGFTETGRSEAGERQLFVWCNTPMSLDTCNLARDSMTAEKVHDVLAPIYSEWYDLVPTLLKLVSTTITTGNTASSPSKADASRLSRGAIFGFEEELPGWSHKRVLLIGDAAHATGPGGQGASTALEDAMYLASLLRDVGFSSTPSSSSIRDAFDKYETHRRPRIMRINTEARTRGDGKLRTYGPWSGWVRDRLMALAVWWKGDSFFRENFGYTIPGYHTMHLPPSISQQPSTK